MADITDNIIIKTLGDTASMATDFGNAGTGFTNSHIPMSKVVWGDLDNGYRTSLTNPLPIQISGQTGPIEVSITSSTGGTGTNISIRNYGTLGDTALEYIAVSGNTAGTKAVGISGWIQGVTNGIPVIIATTGPSNGDYSTGIHLRGAMASDGASYGPTFGGTFGTALGILVQGTSAGATATVAGESFPGYGFGVPIAVTAGRRLGKDTDMITVTGDVGTSRSWTTSVATDSFAVYGADQTQYIRTNLYNGTGGASCGFSGDALKVAVVNGGITFSVTMGATIDIGITAQGGALRIQGDPTHQIPVTIRGEQAGAVDVVSTAGMATTVSGTVTIDDDDILQELKGTTGELIGGLINIKKGTDQISAIRTDLKSGSVRTTVSSIIKPENLRAGSKIVQNDATNIHKGMELLTGVTIKNLITSGTDVWVGSSTMQTNPTNGYLLEPGESIYLEINNLKQIYCRKDGTGSATLHYIGT